MSSPDDRGLLPPSAPAAPLMELPNQIGNYDIIDTLGRGGMGIVYKARDRRLGRTVAIKVLPSAAWGHAVRMLSEAISGEQQTRFYAEARAVARLQHPNIVQIYDIGEHEGLPYVALEFVGGGSLAQKIRKEKMTPQAAAEIVAKLARAVQHAHEMGVLHRDLKPSNILLTPDGQPKIADFGLAKMQENEALSLEGQIIGTPSYMAPEQAAGKIQEIGPPTDIYSLGAILYEALTGRPPFRGASVYETLSQLATEPVVAPQALSPAVSVDLSAICLKCLAKNRDERYASAKALAEDLEACLEGRLVVADVKPQLTSPAERKQPPQAIKDPVRRPWWKFWA
jgi:serine/threonine protein kinase